MLLIGERAGFRGSCLDLSPRYVAVFLGETLYSHHASLHPGVHTKKFTSAEEEEVKSAMDWHLIQ